VVVVLLTITFLGFAVDWSGSAGDYGIAVLGIGTSVVLFPIGYVLSKRALHKVPRTNGTNDESWA
jgi:hypothetical protein